jgi:hypothetical protein
MVLEDRAERNKLRSIVINAEKREIITKEEAGFVISLVERFRADIEKKIKALHMLQGEISQLKVNEQIIVNMIENMVAAAERDIARQQTMAKLKEAREVQKEREAERKAKSPSEQADKVDDQK